MRKVIINKQIWVPCLFKRGHMETHVEIRFGESTSFPRNSVYFLEGYPSKQVETVQF